MVRVCTSLQCGFRVDWHWPAVVTAGGTLSQTQQVPPGDRRVRTLERQHVTSTPSQHASGATRIGESSDGTSCILAVCKV
jgi:hypothetical protein